MTNWLPLLVRDTGLSLSQAALISALFQIGGTLGAVCLGAAMDRFDPHHVLVLALLGGAACLFAIGQCHGDYVLLGLSVAGMGFCISGSQVGANALAAAFYPTSSRATGVSWAHGVGRIGSVCGTFGGALLMEAGLSFELLFGVLMLPAVLAAAAIFFKGARPATALRANPHITL
ncbi:4-hydroxybenzoate transporter PcaK [compost metagenome]